MIAFLLLAVVASARVATPVIVPTAGTYNSAQSVTVSSSAAGDTIYCTTDGTAPRRVASQRYAGSITVSSTSMVQCRAYSLDGRTPSRTASAAYTISAVGSPACATETLRATGTIYYYCECQAGADASCVTYQGNDANDGLTPSTPKRTGAKAKMFDNTTNGISAGDTVALCRGGAFDFAERYTNNGKCNSAVSTCDLRDYTPPGAPGSWPTDQTKRPLAVGGLMKPNTYYTYPSMAGLRFLNLRNTGGHASIGSLAGGGVNGGAPVSVNDVEVCNVGFSGLPGAAQVGASPGDAGAARWNLHHNQISNITAGNGLLIACTDCVIDNNYFAADSYGPNGYYDHPLYVTAHAVATGMRITNNEIHGCPSPAKTTANGTTMLVLHGDVRGIVIENNLIRCDYPDLIPAQQYQGGIQLSGGGYADVAVEQFPTSIIRRNRIVGNTTGISVARAPDALVESNTVELSASYAGYGIELKGEGTVAVSTNVTVRNNTVYVPAPTGGGSYFGISARPGTSSPSGASVTNNVVYAVSGVNCFDLQAMTYGTLANNACNGTMGTTPAQTNPVMLSESPFVSAPTDFTPRADSLHQILSVGTTSSTCSVLGVAGSPCYAPTAPASTTWSATDAGKNRDAQPDIGAMER